MCSVYADVSCWHTHTHTRKHAWYPRGTWNSESKTWLLCCSFSPYFSTSTSFFLTTTHCFHCSYFLFFFFFRGCSHITFLCCALLRLSSQVGGLRTVIFVLYDSLETFFFFSRCFLWKTSLSSLFFLFIYFFHLPYLLAVSCVHRLSVTLFITHTPTSTNRNKSRIWLAVQACRCIYI